MTTPPPRLPVPLAPATYLCGHHALATLGSVLAPLGRRAIVVHGEHGYPRVRTAVDDAFERAGIDASHWLVRGPVSASAIDAAADAVRRSGADMVVTIGGGRVLDVGKAAAVAAATPHVTVPTSASTCAAIRALSVLYTDDGVHLGTRHLAAAPVACIVDLDVVTAAPPRLLASGLLDALAKWEELVLQHAREPLESVGGRSAFALARTIAEGVRRDGPTAIDEAVRGTPGVASHRAAEVAILLPGLVSGLAGGSNAMAVAHAVHDALTHLPGSRASLHGELVGFGLVVQALLDGDVAHATALRELIVALGAPRTLRDLGCAAVLTEPTTGGAGVVSHLAAAPALQRAFGPVPTTRVREALVEADALLA